MIVFDIQAVQSRSHGERGIARYCLEVAHAIERLAPDHITYYSVNPNRPIPESLEQLVPTGKVVRSDEIAGRIPSLLHIGSPVELDLPVEQIVVGRPERLVANLYDLIPLVFRHHYLQVPDTAARYLTRVGLYTCADRVLADSQSAADDAARLLGIPTERFRVIGGGASETFRPPSGGVDEARRRVARAWPELGSEFVLLPAGIDWRKNIEGVVRAYGQLPARVRRAHRLVLVCRASDAERRHLTEIATEAGCADTFHMTGYVSDQLLVALNQAAHLVVMPSRYEGFGLPILEARRCGAPVICGDNSSLREVLPDPRARFDADDVESIRELLHRALTDEDFLQELRAIPVPPLTWERAAQLTIDAHRELLDERRPTALLADKRPRIAYVTPLPPVESGIARYSFRLLGALSRLARVRCFSDQDLSVAEVPDGVAISPLSDLPPLAACGEFDHVVVALGNNGLHASALQMSRRVRSVVHLHDVRLVNCYAAEPWPGVVDRQYPGRFSAAELASMPEPWSPLVQSKSIFLLSDVAATAEGFLVHSDHAASLVELDVGRVPVNIGPNAVPARATRRVPEEGLIVSLGIVSTAKQSDKLAEAAAILHERGVPARLAFVGAGAEVLPHVAPNVEMMGLVDDETYDDVVSRACIAVQLREHSNGESSAAVADCLAAGVPVVVTDIGSFSELPDTVAVKVRRDITAHELASELEQLLTDTARRDEMSQAAVAYSGQQTFDAAAARLMDALERIRPRVSRASTPVAS
jgi:glycosyltransferase involved in cell wall biosynthesis